MSDELTSPMFHDPDVVDLTPHRDDHQPDERRHLDLWLSFDIGPGPKSGSKKPPKMRIRDGETLAAALQRVSLEQFDVAIGHLADPAVHRDTAVHEARKAMKRIRSIVRLARSQIGDDVYRTENVVLRDAARLLSGARTAAVMGRALDHLLAEYAELQPQIFLHLRNGLRQRHIEITEAVASQAEVIDHVLAELRWARARFAAWPTTDSAAGGGSALGGRMIADEFASIAPGLRKVYRRGKHRMADALARPSVEAFHEWRKRVKYLRYQTEALNALWPDVMGGLEASLNRMAETLGEEHDLAELAEFAAVNPDLCTDGERRLLGAIIAKQRSVLQQEAASLGARVYFESPDQFTDRIGAYWDAWHTA